MRSSRKGWPLAAALALPLLLSAGCTGSDVLNPGNSGVVVRASLTNPLPRFDFSSTLSVVAITVRPADPQAAATLGTIPVQILASQDDILNIKLSDDTVDDASRIVLSSGPYTISSIQFATLNLIQTNRPTTWTRCSDFFAWSVPVAFQFSAAELGDEAGLSIEGSGSDEIVLELDGDALFAALVNAHTCVSTPSGPVPTAFNLARFKSQRSTYLRIVG